jgi:hypothetical protein
LTQNKANFFKKLIITLVFKKNANFFAENWENAQKIVIITSTPGHPALAVATASSKEMHVVTCSCPKREKKERKTEISFSQVFQPGIDVMIAI